MAKIKDIMDEFSILYTVIATKDGGDIREFGDKSLLAFPSIVTQYFGGVDQVLSTVGFLNGKELPQTVMQGKVCCIVTELSPSIIGGFFIHNEDQIFARRKLIKKIAEKLVDIDI